jgi:hypothetical protein
MAQVHTDCPVKRRVYISPVLADFWTCVSAAFAQEADMMVPADAVLGESAGNMAARAVRLDGFSESQSTYGPIIDEKSALTSHMFTC